MVRGKNACAPRAHRLAAEKREITPTTAGPRATKGKRRKRTRKATQTRGKRRKERHMTISCPDDIFSPTPWPGDIPACDSSLGFVGLPDEQYDKIFNKLINRKKKRRPFPSISIVDELRGEPYIITLVNGRLYDTSVRAGISFTRPIMPPSEQLGVRQKWNSVSSFGVCIKLGIKDTEFIQILRRKEIALLGGAGVARETVVATITAHAMRFKKRELFLTWEKLAAKLKRRDEIKSALAEAKAARSLARWPKLAARLQHRAGLVEVAAARRAERKREKALKLWQCALRQVIAERASAKPIVALSSAGKKKTVFAEPETRVYAKKTCKKKTATTLTAVEWAKRLSEKEKKLALLADAGKAKAEAVAADAAAREARAKACRLGREIGGC